MIPLTTITGLSAEAGELLAAAGIHSVSQLSVEAPAQLLSRLELIAWQRGRGAKTPSLEELREWVATARVLIPLEEAQPLSVDEIPEAVTEPAQEQIRMPPAMRATQAANGARPHSEPDNAPSQPPADTSWRKVEPGRFATLEEYAEGRTGLKPLSRTSLAPPDPNPDQEPPARRTQRIRSNGEKPSRWVRRGVVHTRPFHTWIGAVVSVIWRFSFVIGIAAFIYLITQVEDAPKYYVEVIAGASFLVVMGLMQIHFAARSRCRICSCNLFYSKNCHKNRKAHHIPGFGYVASASLHLLIFGWFRCMYCGTAIRLRPSVTKRQEVEE